MHVYLAGAFQTQSYLRLVRDELVKHGIGVTSRWLDVTHTDHNELSQQKCAELAEMDLADLDRADYFILFNYLEWHGRGTGGRHVETGYAIARNKPIIYVGEKLENLFHHHPRVRAWLTPHYTSSIIEPLLLVLRDIHKEFQQVVSDR